VKRKEREQAHVFVTKFEDVCYGERTRIGFIYKEGKRIPLEEVLEICPDGRSIVQLFYKLVDFFFTCNKPFLSDSFDSEMAFKALKGESLYQNYFFPITGKTNGSESGQRQPRLTKVWALELEVLKQHKVPINFNLFKLTIWYRLTNMETVFSTIGKKGFPHLSKS
jgi:hypothetical protein